MIFWCRDKVKVIMALLAVLLLVVEVAESLRVTGARIRRQKDTRKSKNLKLFGRTRFMRLFMTNSIIGGKSRFGNPSGDVDMFRNGRLGGEWRHLWTETETVPQKVSTVPDEMAQVRFPSGVAVRPNDTFTSGLLLQFPEVTWDADPGRLYTVMMVDVDIFQPGNPVTNFFHFLATNVPGSNIAAGDTNHAYIPGFAFNYRPGVGLITDDKNFNHRIVLLVYRQPRRIDYEIEDSWCGPQIFKRLRNFDEFVSEYSLGEPVAGTFFRTRYSSTTNRFICIFSRCMGEPFPAPITGVNDAPECQPDQSFQGEREEGETPK